MRKLILSLAAGCLLFAGTAAYAQKPKLLLKISGTRSNGTPISYTNVIDYNAESIGGFIESFGIEGGTGVRLNLGQAHPVEGWRWEPKFVMPIGVSGFVEGKYPNAARALGARVEPGQGYMDIQEFLTSPGRSPFVCNGTEPTTVRSFTVREAEVVGTGDQAVKRLKIDFTDQCISGQAIVGTIEFAADGDLDVDEGDGTAPPPPPFQVSLPDEVVIEPFPFSNSASGSIDFHTAADSTTFNSDLHLSATSDALDQEDFHVSVSPAMIPAPGIGEARLDIKTGPMTFPRNYIVTITAATATASTSSSFIVNVACTPPFILGVDQPKSIAAAVGSQVTLEAKAQGTGPFFYQWYRGRTGMTTSPVAAANSSKFVTSATSEQTYWVRIWNACGSADSLPATVSPVGSLSGPLKRRNTRH